MGDGEGVSAVKGETDFRLEEEFVVLDAALSFASPFAVGVTEDEAQRVLLGMAVRVGGAHEDVEVLCLKVGGVPKVYVHVIVLHGVFDVHREGEGLVDGPFLTRDGLYVTVEDIALASDPEK